MTEADWLACDDPQFLIPFAAGRASPRKRRLFFCALCRSIWDRVGMRGLVEVAERYSDGLATDDELTAARRASNRPFMADWDRRRVPPAADPRGVFKAVSRTVKPDPMLHVAADDAWLRGGPGEATTDRHHNLELSRCIFGNPFRPIIVLPEWRTDTVLALARGMYESRDFSAMPILADALGDAECADESLLAHCRGNTAHARGCAVIDACLGKS